LLIDIIVMAILAVIAGAKGWEDIENYAMARLVGGVLDTAEWYPWSRFVACSRAAQSTSFERCQRWVGAWSRLGAQ